ncbi:MAG: hypothetical protein IKJ39_06395 [Lachnospiraceae bacterium]|nr:hypothetical protein [Lachnospiraceae bacterium]
MFNNIGEKIKTLASVITVIGIIASLILGCWMISANDDLALIGLLVMFLGSLVSWIGSFLLYGFGQLIENSDKLVQMYSSNDLAPKINTDHLSDNATPIHQSDERLNTLNSWLRQGLISEKEYLKKVEETKDEK